jgi:hypothetical protein
MNPDHHYTQNHFHFNTYIWISTGFKIFFEDGSYMVFY